MSKNRKIKTFAVTAALAFAMTGCGEDTVYIGSSEGKDIPSGLYINYLMSAFSEAQSKMTETDTDVFAITIDNMNARDWMISEAKKDIKKYLAVEKKFDEYGLELTDDEKDAAEINVDSLWEYYGPVLEDYGIAESSYIKYNENMLKSDKLFEAVYGEGGTNAVSDEDIKSYMTENYCLVNYIEMHLVDGEGNLLKSDGKAERMEMAKDYVERAKNGEDFDKLNSEYLAYMDGLTAEAAAKAAEEAAQTETEADVSTAEAVPEDANQQMPAETENTVTAEDTVSETEMTSETVTEETAAAETTVPVSEDSGETSYFSADLGELLETDETEGTENAEEASPYSSNKTVLRKDGEFPAKAVSDKVFGEMNTGDITIIESDDSEYYYVVYKMDLLEDDEYFTSAKESLLYEMKDGDYENVLEGWADEVELTLNEKAVERYVPEKFAETEE